jgi:bifunctional DNase/RNase
MPTANGCAVFLGNNDKTFVIYVDHSVGNAIQMTLNGVKKDRPLTHDLIGSVLLGLGAQLEHIVINDSREGTFFARILLRMENELGKKIIEIDARPSDSIVLALQQKRPIYVARTVFDQVEDMSEILERVLKQQADPSSSDEAST